MNGKTTVEAKADVAADRTTIDHKIAARIGAGPVVSSVKVNGEDRRPVAKAWVELNGVEVLLEVSLSDREDKNPRHFWGSRFCRTSRSKSKAEGKYTAHKTVAGNAKEPNSETTRGKEKLAETQLTTRLTSNYQHQPILQNSILE
jgi:hypothetical protein